MDENLTLVVFGLLFAGMILLGSVISFLFFAVHRGFEEQKQRFKSGVKVPTDSAANLKPQPAETLVYAKKS